MSEFVETLTDMELQAIALSGIPSWRPWKFQRVHNGVLCTGAVCPPRTRGPRKGEPNFRKPDLSTLRTVVVTLKGEA